MIKISPQDLDAERALLGSLLLNPNAIDEIQDILGVEDLYWTPHQKIYEVILELRREGKPVDAVTVASMLEKMDALEGVGGVPVIGAILENVPNTAHAEYYAGMIVEKSRLREIIRISLKASEDAYSGRDGSEIVAEAETDMHAILEREIGDAPQTVQDALEEIFRRLDCGEVPGIRTGLEKLDELYHLREGNLIVVAARPSMGKTGLAVSVALNVARRGLPVGFVSCEQNEIELATRFLSCLSKISTLKIECKEPIEDRERRELLAASSEFVSLPIYWIDKPGMTVGKIAAKARLWKRRHGIRLLIIDYLQLVEPEDKKIIREQQVAAMSRGLKLLAGQLDIPVIVLAQLNRQNEKRPDKRPNLSDLRESGAIEQDADCVILIHRPEYYNLNDHPGEAELIVGKNRNGRTGIVSVQFESSTITFRNLAPEWQSGWVKDDF